MVALLYIASAVILLALGHACVTPLTRGSALALLLLPLCFTGRAVLTGRIYAPVEMPYLAQPLHDHAAQLGVGKPHNGAISDIAFQMIPWREALRDSLAHGEWPLLNRFELCGDVLAGAAQPAVFSPFTLIACLLPAPISFTYTAAIAFFLAGLGAFLFARELGCSEPASLFAGAGWMFCGPSALQILWPHGFAWVLLPLVLVATHRIVRVPDLRSIAFLTAALTLEVLAGHPETLLHVVAIACVYGAVELFRVRGQMARVAGAAVLSGVLTAGLTAIDLLPFLDAVRQTREFALRTIGYARTPLRVPPGFVRDVLLGDPFPWLRTASSRLPEDIAVGSVIVALALYSVVFVRARRTWFFVAMFAIALLIGANAWPVAQILHALPLFDRALNERMATAAPLALSMLAAFGVDRLVPRRFAIACIALLAVYGLVALVYPTPQAGFPRLYADLAALCVAAALLLVIRRPQVLLPALFALLLAQRIVADGSLIPTNDPRIAYPRLALLEPLRDIREPFRITASGSILLPNTATMYGLEDVRGHSPITFAALADTLPLWSTTGAGQFHSIRSLNDPMLALMNVRFALQNIGEEVPAGWHEVKHELQTRLLENDHVLDRAFVPRRVRFGTPPDREVEEMGQSTDFGALAWLQTPEHPHDRENGDAAVSIVERSNELHMDVAKGGDGFLVISQTAWRGWRAYVDGNRVHLYGANHAFLAVFVPAGRHTVDLRFRPDSFVIGRIVTLLSLIACISIAIAKRSSLR